jgi:hypothetical protein
MARRTLRVLSIGLLVVVASGCGRDDTTARRLESAVASTFANLIHSQETILGVVPVEASALRASASCHKVVIASGATGGGWRCTVTWFAPGHREALRDTYDVSLSTDGCYTATADGAEAHVGGPTILRRSGETLTNLVYAFDGCFDTT